MFKNLKFNQPFLSEDANNASFNKKTFVISNLQKGFGNTLGNSLRRILLSSLPGIALLNVKIEGINHEFSILPGILEDTMTIIMNLKKIIFTSENVLDSNFETTISLLYKGQKKITAQDLKIDSSIKIINPTQEIANLVSDEAQINLTATLKTGIGYVDAEENKKNFIPELGLISIDSLFSPVENVIFNVEQDLQQQDKLIIEIITNGAISSKEALIMASKILTDYFQSIASLSTKEIPSFIISHEELLEEQEKIQKKNTEKIFNNFASLDQMNFSARLKSSLSKADIHDIQTIIKLGKDHILNLKNLGKKSFEELESKLQNIGLSFEKSIKE